MVATKLNDRMMSRGLGRVKYARIGMMPARNVVVPQIAAEYRAALSISYLPMIVESLIGGLIIGFCVSYFLLRLFDKIPTKNPILKSVILSFIVLIIVTILLGGPASFLTPSDPLRYFLIGALFNVLRILALGIVIGYLYKGLYGSA